MTTFAEIFPPTLQYRDALRQALKNQNITIHETKTRNFSGSMYSLARKIDISASIGYKEYKVLRTVTFVVSTPQGIPGGPLMDNALNDIQVWFTLCGKQLDIKCEPIDNSNENWKIVSTCILI